MPFRVAGAAMGKLAMTGDEVLEFSVAPRAMVLLASSPAILAEQ
jgi:hypothetical protein